MKIAAMILGIIGGLAGLAGAVFALFLGGIGGAFGAAGAGLIAKLGFLAIPFSILGIVGGALANTRPKAAGILMLASALGGVIAISLAYSIAAILLLLGGIFSLIESRKVQPTSSQPLAAPNEEDLAINPIPWYRRKTTWAAVAAVLILPVVFAAAAGGITDSNTAPAAPKDEFNYTVEVNGLGVIKGKELNNVGFAISDIQRTTSVGDRFTNRQAQGEYIIVHLIVANNKNEKITMNTAAFKLVDAQGREYSHSTSAENALTLSKQGQAFKFQAINPGIITDGSIVFDVPSGLSDLKLQISSNISGKQGYLPLQVLKETASNTPAPSAPSPASTAPQEEPAKPAANVAPVDLHGKWHGENEGFSFTLNLHWDEGYFRGSHSSIKKPNAMRTDGFGKEITITGQFANSTTQVIAWKSGYSPNSKGKAEISLIDKNTLHWKIISEQGQHYLPQEMTLTRISK
ncbi:DUF4352 domain-containing protein [Anaeromusa sp.]|uniref:DUF4352 domain-containing protein n=1 Tax=Anaeromusa sp. TaxID=1872520 RepID=UPI00261B4F75|nr:DUF4352 domain-containing protein [Anaeromusa sp.]MDD3157775.1 DUF4352 domain-containing protein [Anaeromusa sp.]